MIILAILSTDDQLVQRGAQDVGARDRKIGNHHAVRNAFFKNQRICKQVLNGG